MPDTGASGPEVPGPEAPDPRASGTRASGTGHGVRVQFVTGGGGAGRTTVAAALAHTAAGRGVRTALLTTAANDVTALGRLAAEVVAVEVTAEFQDRVAALQQGGQDVLNQLGAQPLEPDELTELPGAEALALLRALRGAVDSGYEHLVLDLPPAVDAVRLLLLPVQLERYLTRLLPAERQAARALRPVLAQLAGVPMPAQWLYETGERLRAECAALTGIVEADGSSAVLVVDPGAGSAAAVAEARAGLALAGVPVAVVVANRLVPTRTDDQWLAGWAAAQRMACEELAGSLDHVPVVELPHLGRELREVADLDALGVPATDAAPASLADRVEDRLSQDRELVWRLPLPGAVRERVSLVRRGDEAIVTAGPYRRALPLRPALRRCTVAGARLADGELAVRFTPDPALWPRPR